MASSSSSSSTSVSSASVSSKTDTKTIQSLIPTSSVVQPLLTDMYQLSMAYSYWFGKKHHEQAIFDLFFRESPFKGNYVIFCGVEECVAFVSSFKFSESDLAYLKTIMPHADDKFFDYLKDLDCSRVKLYSLAPGQICYPRQPILRIEGPVIICQLLETTLLALVNYPCLIATNASRFRLIAPNQKLLEFGLRRSQGPDGGLSAARYSFVGGFDGTSNVLAGKLFGIPVVGTLAHSYICSFTAIKDLTRRSIIAPSTPGETPKEIEDFVTIVEKYLEVLLGPTEELEEPVKKIKLSEPTPKTSPTNQGELAAFIAFAQAWPTRFLALIDTYDVMSSGVINFMAVALALDQIGYKAVGIRLDSGDLAQFSKDCRAYFQECAKKYAKPYFEKFSIVASDDINEPKLDRLEKAGHTIDSYGIGTHLVTCQSQPALGCVYKLVELSGIPRIKLSTVAKTTLPGRKNIFRLYKKVTKSGEKDEKKTVQLPVCDVLVLAEEEIPKAGSEFAVIDPTATSQDKKEIITPDQVDALLNLVWDGSQKEGKKAIQFPSTHDMRAAALKNLDLFIPDVYKLRGGTTGYPVRVSLALYRLLHGLIQEMGKKIDTSR